MKNQIMAMESPAPECYLQDEKRTWRTKRTFKKDSQNWRNWGVRGKWHIVCQRPSSTVNEKKPMFWPMSGTFQILEDKKDITSFQREKKKNQVTCSLSEIRRTSYFATETVERENKQQCVNFPSGLVFQTCNSISKLPIKRDGRTDIFRPVELQKIYFPRTFPHKVTRGCALPE